MYEAGIHHFDTASLVEIAGSGDGRVVLVRIITPVHDAQYVDDTPPPLADYFSVIEEAFRRAELRRDCVLTCEPGRAMVAIGCSLLV